jgi:hypothetical protein
MSCSELLRLCTSSFFALVEPTATFGGALIVGGDEGLPKVLDINFPPRLFKRLERSGSVSLDTEQYSSLWDVTTDQNFSSRRQS